MKGSRLVAVWFEWPFWGNSGSWKVVSMFICVTSWITRMNQEGARNIWERERDVQIPGRRCFESLGPGLSLERRTIMTHIHKSNYRRSEKASWFQIWFLLLRVDLRWEFVSTLPGRVTEWGEERTWNPQLAVLSLNLFIFRRPTFFHRYEPFIIRNEWSAILVSNIAKPTMSGTTGATIIAIEDAALELDGGG